MPFIYFGENSDIVEIKESKISGAGQGLFAKKKIKKGDFICWYYGVYVDRASVENGYYESDYLLTLRGQDLVIDASDPLSCYGRYINDSLSMKKTNSSFVSYENTYSAGVKAIKDIKKGDEIYISYGIEFWEEPSRKNKLSQNDREYIEENNDEI